MFLKKKSEALHTFKQYEATLTTQHNARIKAVRLDRGGEYLSAEFDTHRYLGSFV